jgi:hypothetical protein
MSRTMKNNKTNCNVIFWHYRSTLVWPCHQINVCMSSPNLHVFLMLFFKLNPSFSEHNKRWHFWTWRFEEWWAFKAFIHKKILFFCLHFLCVDQKKSLFVGLFIPFIRLQHVQIRSTIVHFLCFFKNHFHYFPWTLKVGIFFKDFGICNLSLDN